MEFLLNLAFLMGGCLLVAAYLYLVTLLPVFRMIDEDERKWDVAAVGWLFLTVTVPMAFAITYLQPLH